MISSFKMYPKFLQKEKDKEPSRMSRSWLFIFMSFGACSLKQTDRNYLPSGRLPE
jgi:hypothetical protein